jgi:thiosulfate dehydrogenase [quinone] large subunit
MTTVSKGRPAPLTPQVTSTNASQYVWAVARIVLGWTFLWAFLDKFFGWGFATPAGKGWIDGGEPTRGFLSGAAKGPFADFYHSIAGSGWADTLFMLGLLGIGLALVLGVGMRIAAGSGALLTIMMWTVALPPANNPVVDEHILYAVVLIGLALVNAGDTFGLGRWWSQQDLVKRYPFLR